MMPTVRVRPTNEELWGRDERGKRVVRKIYVDERGNRYVSVGKYGMSSPRALVGMDLFADKILTLSYIVERDMAC